MNGERATPTLPGLKLLVYFKDKNNLKKKNQDANGVWGAQE